MRRAITEMKAGQADEVVLEAEINNKGALALYENLGFIRDKRLIRWDDCYEYGQEALDSGLVHIEVHRRGAEAERRHPLRVLTTLVCIPLQSWNLVMCIKRS